jgi:hypothetical protein
MPGSWILLNIFLKLSSKLQLHNIFGPKWHSFRSLSFRGRWRSLRAMTTTNALILSTIYALLISHDCSNCKIYYKAAFLANCAYILVQLRNEYTVLPDTKFMRRIILLFNTNFLLSFTVNNSLINKKNIPIALKLQNVSLFLDWKFGTMCTFLKHPLQFA